MIVAAGIAARANEQGRWWSSAMVYAALGLAAAAAISALDVTWLSAERDIAVLEHVAEAAVVVTLYATGLQIDRELRLASWRTVILLLGVVMPLTIAAITLLGVGLLGLSVGAALVLGAALAPTDPVLAGDVGVGPPGSDDPEARFSLTAEASFNDGLAFPFLLAGLAIVADGGTGWIGSWLLIDVVYKIVVGVAVGAVMGHYAARLVLPLRSRGRIGADLDGWLAVAIALAVYGAAQTVSSYGFLAAICAGLAFRRYERDHEHHEELHAGAKRIVQLLELGTIVLVMSMVTLTGLQVPGWQGWLLAALLVFLVRPLTALPLLGTGCMATREERGFVAFFGVRGLGSIYYVGAALGTGVLDPGEARTVLWTVLAAVLVSILVHGITANAGIRALEHQEAQLGAAAPSPKPTPRVTPAMRPGILGGMDLELRGVVCVVTGASKGIGLATAARLGAEGARVLLVGRDADRLAEAARETGGVPFAADVTDPAAAEAIVARAEALGPLAVLVNNAGTSFARTPEELTDADWEDQYALNVLGPMRLMREAAPRMAARGGGSIVNVCSSSGKRPSLTNAAYSVTKAAQLSLSRTWADLHAADGVRVNAVTPGAVGSELWLAEGGLADQTAAAQGLTREEALAAQAAKIPRGRLGEPEEIADVITFLCSARAANVTGAAWSVDGGAVPIIL